ncbi:MAG: hypothetical protein WB869_12995 [Candidatus Acidiferrales bacterium]|jgi:hypothetical protein
MNKLSRSLLGLSLVLTFGCITAAQQNSQGNQSTPKVLQITREYTKPGKAGMAHDMTESAFVQAMARAKWPTHYVGMTSLSGKERALFLTSYDSFEAWEKDNSATRKDTALSAALDRASVADGELLDSVDESVFVFHDELSLRTMTDLSHMRYLQVSVYHVRPGHDSEWNELVKMVKVAYEKAVPDAHWGTYEQIYGGDGGTYIVLIARKTLAEVDRGPLEDKQFAAAMGEDGMKKLDELVSASIESSQHQLFTFNPHMSYVADEWIKADPDFWKP